MYTERCTAQANWRSDHFQFSSRVSCRAINLWLSIWCVKFHTHWIVAVLSGWNGLLQTLLHTKKESVCVCVDCWVSLHVHLHRGFNVRYDDGDGRSPNTHCDAVNYSRFNNNELCMRKGQEYEIRGFGWCVCAFCSSIKWQREVHTLEALVDVHIRRRRTVADEWPKMKQKRIQTYINHIRKLLFVAAAFGVCVCVFVPHFIFISIHTVCTVIIRLSTMTKTKREIESNRFML